jgi:hypothetical protein
MHKISDEELDLLKTGGENSSIGWALAAGGAGVGFSQNLMNAGYAVYTSAPPDIMEFSLGLFSTVLLTIGVVCYFASKQVGSAANSLVEAIRNRSAQSDRDADNEGLDHLSPPSPLPPRSAAPAGQAIIN